MKLIKHLTLMAAATTLITGGHLLAQDWPQWRGPNRNDTLAGFNVPATWPTNLVRKWQITAGKGDSSPVLSGNKLYTFGRQQSNEVVLCLDAATGQKLWESQYPADYVVTGPPARHPGPRSTPVISDGKLITLGVGGILSCFEANTGAVLWRKQSTNDFLGIPYRNETSMSPLVDNGRCIVQVGQKTNQAAVIAFDLATGEPKWKWDADGPANSSPVIATIAGSKQLVTLTAKSLVGLSPADGKQLWQVPGEGNNPTPVINGSVIVYTGQGTKMCAVTIEAQGSSFTATPLWTNTVLGARFATPALKDGALFGYNGKFFCADAKTGATLWTDTVNRGQSAAIIDAASVLLALTVNGELSVFKPSKAGYSEITKFKVSDSETWAHPVIAGKNIFIKDSETVSLWALE